MELTGLSSLTTALSGNRNGDAVDTLVQQKAMRIEAQGAVDLLQALPKPQSFNNPPHLGQKIDVKA